MKKTMKKGASKASQKKLVKDLDVKPAKGGSVRGGDTPMESLKIKLSRS
jgi:hypothetical protein